MIMRQLTYIREVYECIMLDEATPRIVSNECRRIVSEGHHMMSEIQVKLILVMAIHFVILTNQYHDINMSTENRCQTFQTAHTAITSFPIYD